MKNVVKHVAQRTGLVIGSMAFALWLTNIYLGIKGYEKQRFIWGWANELTVDEGYNKRIFSLDSSLIYIPNTSVYNSNDPEDSVLSDKDGFRPTGETLEGDDVKTIVTIGDSFTWGFLLQSKQTYPYFLEHSLRERGYKVNVKNGGVNGYGSDQQFIYLRDHLIARAKPNVVVWNINVNDVEDNNFACLFRPKKGNPEQSFEQLSAWRNTSFIQGTIAKYVPAPIRNTRVGNLALYSIAPDWDRRTIGCEAKQSADLFLSDEQKKKFVFHISEMTKLSEEHDFELVVTLMPNQFYLDPQYDNSETWVELNLQLAQLLEEHAPHFVSLSPATAQYLAGSENVIAQRHQNTTLAQVLGVATSSGQPTQPIPPEEFFIDEGEGARGHWHLQEKANHVVASIVADEVEALLQED